MKNSIFIFIYLFFFLLFSSCITEVEPLTAGFSEPKNPNPVSVEEWNNITPGLHGSFGSLDIRYDHDVPPDIKISDKWEGTAWKGERVSIQLILWSREDISNITVESTILEGEQGNIIESENVNIRTVRYTLTDEFLNGCGYRDGDTIPVHLVADPLENTSIFNIPGPSIRPVWISINIPGNAITDLYRGYIKVNADEDISLDFEINLTVQGMVLPPPQDWFFHLDLWQNPFAVARYHNVEPWSQEHLDLLKPLLTMLAEAGQKCITTSIVDKPWGGQTYDPFESMIRWIRNSSGKWDYDYSDFDHYISLAMECGITDQINCYSMVPWGNQLTYFDEDSANYVTVHILPGTENYENIWRRFLYNFRAHLKETGWLDKTTIALDEIEVEDMKKMISFLKETAPEFKITMAGNYFEEINHELYDFSYNWFHIGPNSSQKASERRKNGKITTFYVACSVPSPNNFTFSPPAEQAFLGWFSAANGFDGFLRWAYNSWVEDPLMDSRFIKWPAGDTYQVYPGPLSSIRFERLREGIQDYEKIRILKEKLSKSYINEAPEKLQDLQNFLNQISKESLEEKPAQEWVNRGKELLNRISELTFRP